MAETMAPSSDCAVDEATITLGELQRLPGVVAVPSASVEARLELERQGFTTKEEDDGVVLLEHRGAGGGTMGMLGFSPTIEHPLTQQTLSKPGTTYPTGAKKGEYAHFSPVIATSQRIEEDREPRNSKREAVRAYVKMLPSILHHDDGHHEEGGKFRICLDKFHFASHGMVNEPEERGYFIHTATVSMTPKWANPPFEAKVSPAAKPRTAVITKGTEKQAAAALSSAPALGFSRLRVSGQETAIDQWDWGTVGASDPSTAAWMWRMRTWNDATPFDAEKSQIFPVGGVPELPYEVNGGVAGLAITDDPAISRHTEVEWDVPTDLITGAAGQLKVEIEIKLDLELIKSKTLLVRIGKKLVKVANRKAPRFKKVHMSGQFAF